MTRTQNSFFNAATSLGSTVLVVVLGFIARTVFVRTLGVSYQGIEGEFTNVLSVLSLADLGISSAIVFKLYKPIEEQDRHRVLVLMKLFRQLYWIIGGVIVLFGLCLIPLLPHLAADYELFGQLGLNPVLIFLIYLFHTASSYWVFAYKSSFVRANQKGYLLSTAGYVIAAVNYMSQIGALRFFHSYMLYIIIQWVFTVVTGIVGAIICNRRYPWINDRVRDRVSREELKEFFKDCGAVFLNRVHNVIINSSDYIVLTAVVGLWAGGLYTNYLYVKNNLRSLLDSVINAFDASIGSVYSTGNLEWAHLIFRVVNFVVFWLYGVGAIALAVLLNEFIPLWLGSRDFVITSWIHDGTAYATPLALLVGVELYIIGYRQYFMIFREAMGLFQHMKFRPIASVLVNLIFCVPGVWLFGPAGCVASTIIAGLTTNLIFDPIVIYKHALKTSVKPYFLRNLLYAAVVAAAGLLTAWVCGHIPLGGIPGFLVRGCVCVGLPSAVFALCFFRSEEFRYLLNTAGQLLRRRM